MSQETPWVYDGTHWHRQRPGTYDPVARVVTPRCTRTPVPAIHFAYEHVPWRQCRDCQALPQEEETHGRP